MITAGRLLLLFALMQMTGIVHARHIVIYIDGTGDSPATVDTAGGEATTNIHRLFEITVNDTDDQIAFYIPGLATHPSTGMLDLTNKSEFIFGKGGRAKRDYAYEQLASVYRAGDKVSMLGFSRGAAIVRDLANFIHDNGVGDHRTVPIEFVGLFDCVASFGIPVDLGIIPTQRINLGKKFVLPDSVNAAYHAVALHELRAGFEPTLIDPRFEEVWFAGGHKDIGGGYVERGMADVTLVYMMERARRHGIRFKQPHPYESVDPIIPGPEMFMFRALDKTAGSKATKHWPTREVSLAQGVSVEFQKIKLHESVKHWAQMHAISVDFNPQRFELVR